MFSSSEQLHTGVCLNFLFHVVICNHPVPLLCCLSAVISTRLGKLLWQITYGEGPTVEGFQRLFRYFFFTTELVGGFKLAHER